MNPYIIIISDYSWALAEKVNEAMEKGYIPHGSMVAFQERDTKNCFMQPMILKS